MEIAGVLVHARPDRLDQVEDDLHAMPGVEVHGRSDDGRLIATVETRIGDTLLALHRKPGVLSATLVYHHFADDEAEETENAVTA